MAHLHDLHFLPLGQLDGICRRLLTGKFKWFRSRCRRFGFGFRFLRFNKNGRALMSFWVPMTGIIEFQYRRLCIHK